VVAKGLTARTVIIMATEDEYIPGRQAGTAGEDDKRRLLYLSLTRARQGLVITFANRRTGQQKRTGRTSGQTARNLTRYLQHAPLHAVGGIACVRDLGR
jgi:superfamily I DNA/RNA helicase